MYILSKDSKQSVEAAGGVRMWIYALKMLPVMPSILQIWMYGNDMLSHFYQLQIFDIVTKQQISVHHVQTAVNDASGEYVLYVYMYKTRERILLNISLSN